MIDTANISARLASLNRSYVDKLYDEAERLRELLEEEGNPVIIDLFERQLREMEENIEAMEDDELVTEDDMLDFAFWFLETYAVLSFLLRRWVVIGWRFGDAVTSPGILPGLPDLPDLPPVPAPPAPTTPAPTPGPLVPVPVPPPPPRPPVGLPDLDPNDPRVTSLVEQMRQNNDNITANTKEEVRTYLQDIEARFGRDLKRQTSQIIGHFRQYFQRRGTSIIEMNVNAAMLRGYLLAMRAAGVQKKQWVSQRDATVRKSHVVADGQIVPINAPFIVGDSLLMHPVDPKGELKEIMRCRCFMVPVAGVAFPEGPQPNVGM